MLRASFELVAPTGGTHLYGAFFQLGGSNIDLMTAFHPSGML
jgi:hypothetical protein